MNPNTVFSASLVTSLVLWFPSMQACLRGDLDLAPAALRYLAALLVSRLALGSLARLVSAYHAAQHSAAPPAAGTPPVAGTPAAAGTPPVAGTPPTAASAPAPTAPQRRRSDPSGADDTDRDTLAA